mmetsp:Transcript_39737/g.62050  ORF Transcript_39737/g.62050 Transcript_39737/m.62050 type:complete len:111 (-) Transcript_39737:60-392(-)
MERLRPFGDRSIVMRMSFEEAESLFPDSFFHLVYIDGYAHTGQDAGRTLLDWWYKVKPGGILAGHDYDERQWYLTYHNVNILANAHEQQVSVINACGDGFQSWAIRKPGG